MLDSHEISNYDKDPSAPRYVEEVKAGKQFLEYLRYKFTKARIVLKSGNHEDRLERYLRTRAPALFGLEGVTFASILELEKNGVEFVGDKRVVKIGEKLTLLHGHEIQMSSQVSPARGLGLKVDTDALCGHYHRSSEHQEAGVLQRSKLRTWSTGCMCNLSPAFLPLNKWNLGFALVNVSSDGDFVVKNHVVVEGKLLV